jgi:amino acid adenylation domain-containing protein
MDRDQPLAVLGVDSVAAVDLLGELVGTLGVTLEVERLYQDATISQIASLLLDKLASRSGLARPESEEMPPAEEAAAEDYPLSHGQRALWFIQQLDPANVAHNVVHALQLSPDTDMAALKQGLQRLIDRHPVLRTTFHENQGEPLQRVHPRAEICFAVHQASDGSDAVLDERIGQEVYRPFDLATGPLFRVNVYSRPPRNPIMLVAMHHIVTDLWSLMIMLAELTKSYDEYTRGIPANLKPIKAAYSDYVAHQAEMLKGPEGERLWQFWREHLAGPLSPLKLPTDRPRPLVPTDRGSALHLACSASLTRGLELLARSSKTNLFTVVFAAFLLLLHRYTGQAEICVGTPKAGRTHKMARVLGYFINPVVLKTKIDNNLTFSDFLGQVQAEVERVSQHDAFPFPLLVERLTPAREQGHTPIFQVMLAWQKTTSAVEQSAMASFALGEEKQRAEVGNLVVGPVFLKQKATPFDWGLWVTETSIEGQKQIRCMLEYKTALFDEETIRRVLHNFETLLESVSRNPDKRLTELPLIEMHEQQRILQWSAASPSPARTSPLVPTLFEDRALRSPDAVAVSQSTHQLTYDQLNRQANQLAHHLRRLGVHAEKRVAVCAERSCEAMVGLIAVLKAGGVYLPLDPASPSERLAFMLQDAMPEVVLTQSAFKERFRGADTRVVLLDADEGNTARENCGSPDPEVHPENAAYVIYTSGTTGKPKAVVVPHGEFVRHCVQMAEHYQLTPGERVLQFAALNFDASLEQIAPTLISGATVELMGRQIWEPVDFQAKVNERGISVANLPPAYFHQVAQEWNPDLEPQGGRLRLVVVGGDALPPASLDVWRQRCRHPVRLLNAYGPTETTVTATTYAVGAATETDRTPVGRPLPGRRAFILDRSGNLAPIGVMGELHLGGAGLARGYLGRPDRTAEAFIPDAFGTEAGARLYRTGDLARHRSDGCIEVLGRVDHQVKIRGFRIELGEIEAALTRHPDIREAVVDVHADAAGDRQLAAYVVGRGAGVPTPAALRAHLKRHLPDYMIPSVFVRLDALPMASSGKVDRKSLPTAVAAPRELSDDYAGPRTATEAELAGMWAEVLGMQRVGIHDNFFDLGGHSLKATQLVSRIRATFFVELPLRSLFDEPTVAGLAALIEKQLISEESDEELNRMLAELEGGEEADRHPDIQKEKGVQSRAG